MFPYMKSYQFDAVWKQMDYDEKCMTALFIIVGWENNLRDHLLSMRKKYLGW